MPARGCIWRPCGKKAVKISTRNALPGGLLCFLAGALLPASEPATIVSRYSSSDFPLTADPHARQWRDVPGVFAENGPKGEPVPGHRTEIRSIWTAQNIYFLF